MFNKISLELQSAGFQKTGVQCNCKIRKLKLEYRKIKDERSKMRRGRKEGKFFEAMDCVLGHKPATQPPVVVESGERSSTTNPVTVDEVEEHTVDKPDDPASSNSSSRSVTPVHVVDDDKGNKSVRKKRKRSSKKVNKVEELVEKVLKCRMKVSSIT